MEKPDINPQFLSQRPLSYSALKAFRKSPKHYLKYLSEPREQTDAMLNGSLVDCLLLEPEKFNTRYQIYEKPNLRTNEGKAEQAKLLAVAAEKNVTLVSNEMVLCARRQVDALMSHNVARAIIENRRRVQLRMKWMHKATGIPMVGYLDFESHAWEDNLIVDLKTTKSADPDNFIRDAANLDYHIQAGAYLDGYTRTQFIIPNMAFMVVESDEPHNVAVYFCDSEYTSRALNEFHNSVQAFKYCMDNDLWKQGYDFRMMGTRDYFSMSIPKYKSPLF